MEEKTLSIVKPDGVEKNLIGEIFRRFEQAGEISIAQATCGLIMLSGQAPVSAALQ